MALATEKSAETFLNIVASTPIDCNWPLYAEDEVVVVYGSQSLEAVYPSDFTVTLSPPNYNTFTITPTAALLTKINDLIASPPTDEPEINYITVRRTLDYLTSVTPESVRQVSFLSREIERIHMRLIQLAERVYRTIGLAPKEVGDVDVVYTVGSPVAGKAAVWDETETILIAGPDAADIANAEENAATATAQAAIATAQAGIATAQAAVAQAYAQSGTWTDTIFTTTTPLAVDGTYNGKIISIDTSAGNKIVNLPTISGLTPPFNILIIKSTNDANTITVNRGGSDQIGIDGGVANSAVVDSGGGAISLSSDTDPTPDRWAAVRANYTADGSVTNAKLANMAATTIKANITGGSAAPVDSTLSAILDTIVGNQRGQILMRGSGAWGALSPGTANYILRSNGAGADLSYIQNRPVSVFRHTTADGANPGGGFTSGSWQTRTLNNTLINEISGVSLGSNQITLPAGTYEVDWTFLASRVDEFTSAFVDITAGATIAVGTFEDAEAAGSTDNSISIGSAKFTIAGTHAFELRGRCQTTNGTDGYGRRTESSTWNEVNVWASVKITKCD